MTIHAFTEPSGSYPAFVNLSASQSNPDEFVLIVRSKGNDGRDAGNITLTRAQLLNLINDAAEYLDGQVADHPEQAAKNQAIAADRDYETMSRRAQVLDMALRTPGLVGHDDVLKAAAAYQAHIGGEQTPPAPSEREQALEELVRSACAIAERQGADTAWDRFVASARALGLNGVTARTYRILPSDEQ